MSPDGETEVVPSKPKRAPRKRVLKEVSNDAGNPAPVKRAPAKRTSKRGVEESIATKEVRAQRKAPTPIADDKVVKKKSRKQFIVIAAMIIIGVGASAAVGMTDKGRIDVDGIIAWRNEEARSSGNTGAIVSEQNTPQLPDGGLIGLGVGGPIGEASTTPSVASTTPPTASSTEPVGQIPLTKAEAEAAAQATPTEVPTQ
ncbi:MAG: hypothetical protein KBC62_01675 [Candidatus Pacebacteria bacterium]|nr:hypothetical protein [Candidatus Paceibacterota bacterium]